jgi:hypothetical protein
MEEEGRRELVSDPPISSGSEFSMPSKSAT